MNKFELIGTDTFVYNEKLPCGLDVYLIPFAQKKNYFMSYFTKFGSINTEFSLPYEKKTIKVPSGIAHFLEHKMFEQENGEVPFDFFSQSGTGCNASTGFKATRYIVYGTNNLKENLSYLIQFVNSPYFTPLNVEKEKGIIAEEIKMYDDNPEWILTEEMEKATFKVHPIRDDIAGYIDTIANINCDQLYQCYNAFYQPSNMGLVIGGNFDVEEITAIIRNHPLLKDRQKTELPILKKCNEPLSVNTKLLKIPCHNIANPKAGFSIKLPLKGIKDVYSYNVYIGMILNIIFGTSSTFREEAMKNNLLSSMIFERMIVDDYLVISFWLESLDPMTLIDKIKDVFNNYEITKEEVERCKKVWISSEVVMTDNVELTVDNLINDIIEYGKVINDRIKEIRKMNLDELNKIKKTISLDNNAVVILLPELMEKKES